MVVPHTDLDIAQTTAGDMTNAVQDVTVAAQTTDGPSGSGETEYINSDWSKWLGYYKAIPEVKVAIDMRAIWTVGKGYSADSRTTVLMDHWTGWGNDTANTILNNLMVVRRIGGESFAEIIRDPQTDVVVNLKPLDPGAIKTVTNKQGIIIRYEQVNSIGKTQHKFKPKEIFHLVNKRVADEIHGVSDIEAIEKIIKASNESFDDVQELQHRYVRPRFLVEMDTDNQTKIDNFITKFDSTVDKGENVFVPKGSVSAEVLSVPSNATLNPMPWRQHLRDYFFQVVGIPQIILGSSGEFTESTAKIAYLAFEQSVKAEQRDLQEQMWNQLFLRVKFEFPASLQNELLSDEGKDEREGPEAVQPSDITAETGR